MLPMYLHQYNSVDHVKFNYIQYRHVLLNFLVSSNASVASSTISSIDVLGEDLTNHRFGRLYRRWLKCANRTMKQNARQVR